MGDGFVVMDTSNQVLEFFEFVESQPRQSVRQLLDKILLKSRLLTGAEAGTVFVMRKKGAQRWLEPASVQNDRVAVRSRDFVVPVTNASIAGYVAGSGDIVRVANVYRLPSSARYAFNPDFELRGYRTVSVMCFPIKNYQEDVIGVVQLINRQGDGANQPIAFEAGQARLVTLVARALATHIERAQLLENIRDKNAKLRLRNQQLAEQRSQVVSLQAETEDAFMLSISLLARAAEIHDEETANHIVRVNEYSFYLADKLGMPKAFCDEIRYSAQLHDVGKMSVNSAVLKKRGRLNVDERAEMDLHPLYGFQILEPSPRLKLAAEIALHHHEKWDGSGYPAGVSGEDIPISARIVSLADVYDALRSKRPYKPAYSHEKTCKIMMKGDDRIDPIAHFDPNLLRLFGEHHAGMRDIYKRLAD